MKTKFELQHKLRSEGLDALLATGKVIAKRHSEYPNLVLLKYSKDAFVDPNVMAEKWVQQARGVIFDESDDWNVVARSFDKFFNYREKNAATLGDAHITYFEKVDGSLCSLWWYNDSWHVSTSGSADAKGEVPGDPSLNFKDLFWNTFNSLGYKLPEEKYRDVTFIFELTTPVNRIVVQHKESKLFLLGARYKNNYFDEVFPFRFAEEFNWEYPKTYSFKSLDEAVESAKGLNGFNNEGYVAVDLDFNRVKIKSPDYVQKHHSFSNMDTKGLIEIIKKGELPETIVYFPEWEDKLHYLAGKVIKLIADMTEEYDKYKHIESRKDFALAIKDNPYRSFFFKRRDSEENNFVHIVRTLEAQKILELIKEENKYV